MMRPIAAMTVGCDVNASDNDVWLYGESNEGKSKFGDPATSESGQVTTDGEGGGETYGSDINPGLLCPFSAVGDLLDHNLSCIKEMFSGVLLVADTRGIEYPCEPYTSSISSRASPMMVWRLRRTAKVIAMTQVSNVGG